MSPSAPIEAVTFDFWNTICVAGSLDATRASRLVRLRDTLADAGAEISEAELDVALLAVRDVFDEHWKANLQYTYREGVQLMLKVLDVDLEEVHLHHVTGSFTGESADHTPDLAPNLGPVLRQLHDAGIRLGIICDVGLSPSTVLRRHLERHGVLELFDHFSFSDDVGFYKPAPEIFEHALAGLDAEPSRAVHIGDLCRTDVAGAKSAGMMAVRYVGIEDDSEAAPSHAAADHVIADHLDLCPILGL